jgi:hypothetical protein
MSLRVFLIVLLFALSAQQVAAQQVSAEIATLDSLYREFRYQEVIRQAETIIGQKQHLPVREKCEILRFLALSYYVRQDMQGALKNFAEIIALDSHYRLDPITHSPKILAFFEEIRRQKQTTPADISAKKEENLTNHTTLVQTDSLVKTANLQMALSFILPGSGQLGRNEKTKGWLLLSGNFLLLGGFIYFSAETNRLEDQYLQAIDRSQIATAWEKYNQTYINRNRALAGFLVLWLYTQIDFLYFSLPSKQQANVSWYPKIDISGRTALTISLQF